MTDKYSVINGKQAICRGHPKALKSKRLTAVTDRRSVANTIFTTNKILACSYYNILSEQVQQKGLKFYVRF